MVSLTGPGGLMVFRDEERGSKVSVVKISDFAAAHGRSAT
jgi:hypothetical protein